MMALLAFMGLSPENCITDRVAPCMVHSYLLLTSGYQLLLSAHESFKEGGTTQQKDVRILQGMLLLLRSGGSALASCASFWGLALGAARQLLPQGRDEESLHAWVCSARGEMIPAEAFVAASVQVLILALKKGATPILVDCAVQLANMRVLLPDQTPSQQTLAVSLHQLSALLAGHSAPPTASMGASGSTVRVEANRGSSGSSNRGSSCGRGSSGRGSSGRGSSGRGSSGRGSSSESSNRGSSGSSSGSSSSGSSSPTWSVHAFMQAVRLNAFQVARGAYASCAEADQEACFFENCRQIADLLSAAEEEHDEQQQQQLQQQQQRGELEEASATLASLQLSPQEGQGKAAQGDRPRSMHSHHSSQSQSCVSQGENGTAQGESPQSVHSSHSCLSRNDGTGDQSGARQDQGHVAVQADSSGQHAQRVPQECSAPQDQGHDSAMQAGHRLQAALDPEAEDKQASLEAGYAGAWVLLQQGLFKDAHAWATALVHSAGKVWAPMLLAQAAWLAARCMLVLGGSRDTFDRLIQVAYAAEQHLSSRAPECVPISALGGSITCLAVDVALALVAEGRAEVIDFHKMLTESEERKGFRMANVPAQPKFYGGSRLAASK